MKQSIEIHIDELILHGFPLHQRHQIAEMIQAELQHLLTTNGIPEGLANGGSSHFLDAGSFDVQPTAKPGSIGKSIAGSVYNRFSNGK